MTVSQPELEELIRKSIIVYNRLRSPEITAKLIAVSSGAVTLSFSGGFCYSCGILGYVESFAQQFKTLTDKVELKVGKTRQITQRTFEADFNVKIK
jgi:hypothetical protein